MRNNGTLLGDTIFRRKIVGGGGFVANIAAHATGRQIICCDVTMPNIRDNNDDPWRLMFDETHLAAHPDLYEAFSAENVYVDARGGYSAAFFNGDATGNTWIVGCFAKVWRTTDGGVTFTECNLPLKYMRVNWGNDRLMNQKFSYHPTDTLKFLIGTDSDGIYYTADGGATFTTITSVPAGVAVPAGQGTDRGAPHLTAIDHGAPLNVYISRYGTGVYRSTTGFGASAFSHVTGGPTRPCYMRVMPDGSLWVVNFGDGADPQIATRTVWKLPRGSSTWQQITGIPFGLPWAVAMNPDDHDHIYCGATGMYGFTQSFDGGATWDDGSLASGAYIDAPRVPWLGGTGTVYHSSVEFNPAVENEVLVTHGRGVLTADAVVQNAAPIWTWTESSYGNEMIGMVCSRQVPGSARAMFGTGDKGIMYPRDTEAADMYPTYCGANGGLPGNESGTVTHCWAIDYAPEDHDRLVANISFADGVSGYSENGGLSFKRFISQGMTGANEGMIYPGGSMVTTGVGKIIWCTGNNGPLMRSEDNGATWLPVTIAGSQVTHVYNSMWTARDVLTSDKERPGHAAIILSGVAPRTGLRASEFGMWKTEDHGASWTQKWQGKIGDGDPLMFWDNQLKYIPGHAGCLIWSSGFAYSDGFYLSEDDGASWTRLPGIDSKSNAAFFGAKMTADQEWPTLYSTGVVNGVEALYRSTDMLATDPVRIGEGQLGIMGIDTLLADPNIFGRVWVSFGGGGLMLGKHTDVRAVI